jgi:exonuclease III
MSSPTRPSLSLLTLNVNGLGSAGKRRTLFHMLLDGPWDVIVLQETHHADSEQGIRWAGEGAGQGRPWAGDSYWAHGTSASRGVAILTRARAVLTDAIVQADASSGRILRLDFTWEALPLSVVCVYAPSSSEERVSFYALHLLPALPVDRHILLGGDFNCVAGDLDVTPNALGSRRVGYSGGLQLVEETHGLLDAWRELHPGVRGITHTCASNLSGGRLDRWLLSSALLPSLGKAEEVTGLPGDHQAVAIRLYSPNSAAGGPGGWLFPLALLDDATYVAEARAFIASFLEDNPVTATYTHGQRWDALKRAIRDHASVCFQGRQSRARQVTRSLEAFAQAAKVRFLLSPEAPLALTDWQVAQARLQDFHTAKAAAAATRAGILWQQYGEQSTFYFYHLAKQRQRATTLASLQDSQQDNTLVDLSSPGGRVQGGEILARHFSSESPHGLFTEQETSAAAQTAILASLDSQMAPDLTALCDAPVTLQDLSASLTKLPRGKQPGSDGLPYEFYQAFWPLLGMPLLEVFRAAFASASGSLTPSQLLGTIVLLYKGSGPRSDPASYRPITLLNADAKLLGKVLADRWGAPLSTVVDTTQTAFLPDRWIGDNILAHLEEVDYLESAQQPGCLVFLDFSKAYDRLNRGWVDKCMAALGFGPAARRWVSLLHDGLQCRVRYNGWLSPSFPVNSGLAQGSPLSPLLYVAAAQPLAAHLRQEARLGHITPLSLPDGSSAPPCHQHADDTSLHLRTRADVSAALQGSIHLFCAASGSQVNPHKSQGLILGPGDDFSGVDPASGIPFSERGASVRHLGVRLSTNPSRAAREMFTPILAAIRSTASHWASRQLTQLGRVHVAKQVLASKLTHHATFVRPPPPLLRELTTVVMQFVAGTGATRSLPSRLTFTLPWAQGGMRLVNLEVMVDSLQAKIIARLLEPQQLPWKAFFHTHFSRSPLLGPLRYGPRSLFLTKRTQDLGIQSRRATGYVASYRRLLPHRLVPPSTLTRDQVLREPLFLNAQVTEHGLPLLTAGVWQPMVLAGVTSVGHLLSPPPCLSAELLARAYSALPACWSSLLWAPDPAPAGWYVDPRLTGRLLLASPDPALPGQPVWSSFTVLPDNSVQELSFCPPLPPLPIPRALVVEWDSTRPWRPGHTPTVGPSTSLYFVGESTSSVLDPALWGFGKRLCTQLVVREAADRLTTLLATKRQLLAQPSQPCRPAIWEDDWEATEFDPRGLRARERRWCQVLDGQGLEVGDIVGTGSTGGLEGVSGVGGAPGVPSGIGAGGAPEASSSRARGQDDLDYSQGAPWMRSSSDSRQHWHARQLAAAEMEQQQPQPQQQLSMPLDDTLNACSPQPNAPAPAWAPVWSRIHDLGLDRQHRLTAWRLLHGALWCGALRAYIGRRRQQLSLQEASLLAACPRPACQGQPETLTHLFLTCPASVRVWSWIAAVWTQLSGSEGPPLSAALLMADDQRHWQPGAHLQPLWTQLRIATLAALHSARAQRRKGIPTTATSVAARLVHLMRSAMLRDWQRVRGRNSLAALADGVCCSTWLRGRQPFISLEQFQQHWGQPGALYQLSTGALYQLSTGALYQAEATPQLTVLWTVQHPTPIPMGPGG